LTGTKAIKIALVFRPLLPFGIVLKTLLQGGFDQLLSVVLAERNGGKTFAGKIRFFCDRMFPQGIHANWHEYQFYQAYSHLPIAPVRSIHLGGLILVMHRGEDATADELRKFRRQAGDSRNQVFGAEHLKTFGDRVKIVDYGSLADARAIIEYQTRLEGSL
jgi:hypothetical protein